MILVLSTYAAALLVISIAVAGAEALFPWRPEQKQIRPRLGSDLLHLLFNGHFLGLIFYGLSTRYLLPPVDRLLAHLGWTTYVYRNAAAAWPLAMQILVALLVIDFVQWCVHNLLHRVPWFWQFHKCHHSVVDGEMDWIVSFRFQWTEVVVYRLVGYLPLAFFGFDPMAILVHAIFGTLIGHLNHANLRLDYGWGRYILNSPRMHLWHHDYDGNEKTTVNFGIIFSLWDWIFGTAKMPDEPPPKIGFHGVEDFPKGFFEQEAWPLQAWLPQAPKFLGSLAGAALIALGYLYGVASPSSAGSSTPMLGEKAASSQPKTSVSLPPSAYSKTPEEATLALAAFGSEARAQGFRRPEALVSVRELAKALGSPRLVLLDIRPLDRFQRGHIPSARSLERREYTTDLPLPGFAKDASALQTALRLRGVKADSVLVLYTDGSPDAFGLWWILKTQANLSARVLDGGLQEWKSQGHGIAEGPPLSATSGDLRLSSPTSKPARLWKELSPFHTAPRSLLLDARDPDEYHGKRKGRHSTRSGHIPNARNLPWHRLIQSKEKRTLRPPAELRALFTGVGWTADRPTLVYCESGARSSALYFALLQLGHPDDSLRNYDGSWIEYSRRTDLPVSSP